MFQESIDKGVDFLKTQQQKDGCFISLSSKKSNNFNKALPFHSPFSTSLILSNLSILEETQTLHKIKFKAANFLLTQKTDHWSFNYWRRNSKEAREKPYPDDLDDTFCALSSLYTYNPHLINGAAMAKIIQLLITTETREGGPYRTWLVEEKAQETWKDVDIAVNSNVGYFLSLKDVNLQNIDSFIERSIESKIYKSSYYPNEYPIIYFISRFYKGSKTGKIREYLLSKINKNYNWGNPMNTALAISSLLNLGVKAPALAKSIRYLVSHQKRGFWKPYGFCLDPTRESKKHYSGSTSLTTSFCMAAIYGYMRSSSNQNIIKLDSDNSPTEVLYREVIKKVKQDFSKLNKELKKQSIKHLQKIIKKDSDKQIVLLPYYFKLALAENGKEITNEILIQLGAASLLGWIAYTIYDDFFDDEGDPRALSTATLCLRRLTAIFDNVFKSNEHFQGFFHELMDDLDGANMWEIMHCRIKIGSKELAIKDFLLPHFRTKKQLAQKSLGHALGPVALLFLLGYKKNSPEVTNLLSFFRNYLIARQLNDDAHDWQKDMKKGHLTPVVTLLLKKFREKNPSVLTIDTKPLMDQLNKIFWYEVVVSVCEEILIHVKAARDDLHKSSVIVNKVVLEKLLLKSENAAKKALNEQKQTIEFLKTY